MYSLTTLTNHNGNILLTTKEFFYDAAFVNVVLIKQSWCLATFSILQWVGPLSCLWQHGLYLHSMS